MQLAIEGDVIRPTDARYDAERKLWNAAIDRRPAAIARVRGAADIAAVLQQAQAAGVPVSVRGGGHSAPGHSAIDGAVMIDLSQLRTVTVDAARRRAKVGGGALWSHVDAATAAHGLATTGGLVSHTGVGGLTLGGGIGWLMRKHGLAVDNLVGADVVLADGRAVHASADELPELFWALRGGGGNFGVVTSFELALHPVKTVVAGMVMYPGSHAGAVLRFFRELAAGAPDELTLMFATMTAPPAPFVPQALQGRPACAILACYAGDLARGAEVLRPLKAYGPPAVDLIGEMPYVALQSMLDEPARHGQHNHMKSAQFDALSDAAIEAIVAGAAGATSAFSAVHVHHLGGAVSRVADAATAYTGRQAQFTMNIIATWHEPAGAAGHVAWARGLFDAVTPHTNGSVYVNFLGDEGPDRVRAAYGPEKLARLVEVKRRYDPTNVFRFNQNIKP